MWITSSILATAMERPTSTWPRSRALFSSNLELKQPGRLQASINEHRVLIDAFEQRDAARAERAMHDHLLAQLAALRALRAREQDAAVRHA